MDSAASLKKKRKRKQNADSLAVSQGLGEVVFEVRGSGFGSCLVARIKKQRKKQL